ncbi:hypothetical protein RJT34_25801 [Clitoria ternatea]|uniref:Uncharacterized protein n=1 Tax=Clitoria ternatea TaxID=43366 RepID=A0AAN9IJ41_CLITE
MHTLILYERQWIRDFSRHNWCHKWQISINKVQLKIVFLSPSLQIQFCFNYFSQWLCRLERNRREYLEIFIHRPLYTPYCFRDLAFL